MSLFHVVHLTEKRKGTDPRLFYRLYQTTIKIFMNKIRICYIFFLNQNLEYGQRIKLYLIGYELHNNNML